MHLSTVCDPEDHINIVKGEDKDIDIILVDKKSGEAFDLTGATPVKTVFQKQDGTLLTVDLLSGVVILAAQKGKLRVSLTDTNTALLKTGDDLDFEVEVTIGVKTTIVQFRKTLSVAARLV